MKTIIKLIFIFLLIAANIGYSAQLWPKASTKVQKANSQTVSEKPQKTKVNSQKPKVQNEEEQQTSTQTSQKGLKKYYGAGLCNTPGYTCIKIKSGDTWQKLWPDPTKRHIIQAVNRSDTWLIPGTFIAVPNNLATISLNDVAPFPKQIKPSSIKLIIVDQDKLAWGAYDRSGKLIRWGAISSGKNYCPDIKRSCKTITGEFYVFEKRDKKCKSNIFPVGKGGAIMPYCMFFYRGYALHGSLEVVGRRDSHGCVRMFLPDAEWLNQNFTETPKKENNYLGTKVVVEKLTSDD